MFYLSFFRKTALFGMISFFISICMSLVPINFFLEYCLYPNGFIGLFCAFMFWSVPAYFFLAAMHIFVCKKILKSEDGVGKIFFGSFFADLFAPIRSIVTFVVVITSKHVIHDDSEEHEFEDFVQVVAGFIWTVILTIYLFSGFWTLTHV